MADSSKRKPGEPVGASDSEKSKDKDEVSL